MKITTVDERMTANYRDRQVTFQIAEAALVEAEAWVESTDFDITDLYDNCNGATCFNTSCTNGLCDTKSYRNNQDCELEADTPWNSNLNVWETSGRHRTVTITFGSESVTAKYIVEFRCYIPYDLENNPTPANPPPNAEWSEYYRITTLAEGDTDGSKVMLQSTYKKI
jgi:type IV pilus assembly protein PilX